MAEGERERVENDTKDEEEEEREQPAKEAPIGRKPMVTEDDLKGPDSRMLARLLALFGLSAEEELMILFLMFAGVYVTAKKIMKALVGLSPSVALSGAAAGGLSGQGVKFFSERFKMDVRLTECIHTMVRNTPASNFFNKWRPCPEYNFRTAQREWVLRGPSAVFTSPVWKISPITWGLRLCMYQNLLYEMTRGDPEEPSLTRGFATRFCCGATSEVFARLCTSPVLAYSRYGSFLGVRAFQGQPSLLVEAPHMGLLLGVYGGMKEKLGGGLAVDALCGIVSSFAATCATHQARQYRERSRHLHTESSTFYHPRPYSFLPLRDILSVRVPQAAVLFPLFTFIVSLTKPELASGGLVGWDEPPEIDKFGEPIYERVETVKGIFTGIPESRQTYSYREKRAKAAVEELKRKE